MTFPALPDRLSETRTALHRLAAYVIAPARHVSTGRFGLRATPGGFGTPFFGGDHRRIRVEGTALVDERGSNIRSEPITTLRAAAHFLETDIDPSTAAEQDTPALGDVDADLGVDESAAALLAAWFSMAFSALEKVRADDASVDASRPQLWPGHFDAAIEIGTDAHRASYGASPGDAAVDEPYLYVSLWSPDRAGISPDHQVWNATSFTGRLLLVSDFARGSEPAEVAAGFWRETRDLLER